MTKIAKLDNVQIVPLDTDTYELQDKCSAVATVTGTAGFEAINRGKPFLMFGKYITMYAPGVFQIRSNSDCEEAMKRIEEKFPEPSQKDLRIYYKALEMCTFKGLADLACVKQDEVDVAGSNTADAFVTRIKELTHSDSH